MRTREAQDALTSLIRRVEEATTGNDYYDLDRALAFQWPRKRHPTDGRPGWTQPRYTSSLDAALALVERCLPGWCWEVGYDSGGPARPKATHWAAVYADWRTDPSRGEAPTPALALILAMLKAMEPNTHG